MHRALWKTIAALAIGVGIYWLAATLLLPLLITRWMQAPATDAAGWSAHIGAAEIHPFTFAVKLHDVQILGPEKRPLVSIGLLGGDAHVPALFRKTLSFRGNVVLSSLATASLAGDAPALRAETAWCGGLAVDFRQGSFALRTVAFLRPAITVVRDLGGRLNHPHRLLWRSLNAADGGDGPRSMSFVEGSLRVVDRMYAPEARLELTGLAVSMSLRGSGAAREAAIVVAGRGDTVRTLSFSARWRPGAAGGQGAGQLSLGHADAVALSPYIETLTGLVPESGTVSFRLDIERGKDETAIDSLLDARNAGWRVAGIGDAAGQEERELGIALLHGAGGHAVIAGRDRRAHTGRLTGLMAQLHRGVLTAAARAPFETLAEIVAWQGDGLETVGFRPGSAELTAKGAAALAALGAALSQRPLVGVTVWPGYDKDADREALARQQVTLHVKLATSAVLPGQVDSRPLDFDDARVRGVLDEFAGTQLSAMRRALLADGEFGDRRGYYTAVFEELVASQAVEAIAWNRLARFRARTVAAELGRLGIDRERLQLATQTGQAQKERGLIKVRLELWPLAAQTRAASGEGEGSGA